MVDSGWTHDGSRAGLFALSVELKRTGQIGLRKNIGVAVRVATKPAAAAVKRRLLAEMPKAGGLNVRMAKTPVRTSVLTGVKSEGVVMRRATGRRVDLTGQVRHPVFGNPKVWAVTDVPTGWWESTLEVYGIKVRLALQAAMDVTAREAGFL